MPCASVVIPLNKLTTLSSIHCFVFLLGKMPRKCNDIDLVTYSELKPTKAPAPLPPPIPYFEPLIYPTKQNTPYLPASINTSDSKAIFNTFFDKEIIKNLIIATNCNAERKRAEIQHNQRL